MTPPRLLVIAGEVSGDLHAAALVEAVRRRAGGVDAWGIGGDGLRAAGVEVLHDVHEMAVMGLPEVLRKYAFFRHVFDQMRARVRERKPDAVVLVDYPGFNLRFARAVHGTGPKVIYYVCPQVWAWHRARVRLMARIVDRLLVIFPFEKEVFAHTDLRVDFVGHPLVDELRAARGEPERPLPWPGPCRVALLPGSRVQEIDRILPVLAEAARRLRAERPDAGFLVAAPSPRLAAHIEEVLSRTGGVPDGCRVVTGETRQMLRQARAAWVTSGTATIEAALLRCPSVVVYRTAPLTYWLAKALVRVPHIGMVNIVAGRELCPERIQGGASPAALVRALRPLLDDTPERAAMQAGFEEVAARMGGGGAADRAAAALLEELGGAA